MLRASAWSCRVVLRVWDFEMPAERHLSVVNWWSFPGLGFSGRVEEGSSEYYALLDRFCRFLVEHRQTDVNTTIGLIHESGNAQEGYTHDTSRLERYAATAFAAGIRQIQLHSVAGKYHADSRSRRPGGSGRVLLFAVWRLSNH